jgi:hypothetical protein
VDAIGELTGRAGGSCCTASPDGMGAAAKTSNLGGAGARLASGNSAASTKTWTIIDRKTLDSTWSGRCIIRRAYRVVRIGYRRPVGVTRRR